MTGKIIHAFCLILLIFAFNNSVNAQHKIVLKTIIVDNYQPYTFLNDKSEPDGFSVEIAKAVTSAMGLELQIRADKWDQAMRELEAGSIDLLPMMAYSPERDKIFDFSVPHTIAYDTIFFKKGTTGIRSLKDLSGKTVIVMNRDIAHNYLISSGLSETMSLNLVDSLPEALKQLAAGKGDAAIMPKLVGIVTLKKLNIIDIDTSPILIDAYRRPFSFAVKDGNKALLERFNQGLNIVKSSGQYDEIYKKWFGLLEDPHINWNAAFKYIVIVALILIGIMVWNMLLRRQVKARTVHLEAEIMQRKQLYQDLLETKELFSKFMHYSPVYTFIKEVTPTESRVLQATENFQQMVGIPGSKMIGKTMTELFPPEFAAKVTNDDWAVASSGKVLTIEETFKDRIYSTIRFPLVHGEKTLLAGYTTDISERKRTEHLIEKRLQISSFAVDHSISEVLQKTLDLTEEMDTVKSFL